MIGNIVMVLVLIVLSVGVYYQIINNKKSTSVYTLQSENEIKRGELLDAQTKEAKEKLEYLRELIKKENDVQ